MLVFAQPAGSGLVDTTPSKRLCCAGQTGLVCSLSGENPKSCFRSGLKTAGVKAQHLQTAAACEGQGFGFSPLSLRSKTMDVIPFIGVDDIVGLLGVPSIGPLIPRIFPDLFCRAFTDRSFTERRF
jgi:hypothetical protein